MSDDHGLHDHEPGPEPGHGHDDGGPVHHDDQVGDDGFVLEESFYGPEEEEAWAAPAADPEPWTGLDLDLGDGGDPVAGGLHPGAGPITLAGDGDGALVASPFDDLMALPDGEAADAGVPDPADGDGPIDLSLEPGALDEALPPGLAEEPSWELVPDDNGAVGAGVLGLAAAGAIAGLSPDDLAAMAEPADGHAAVALLERLGAVARLEHGGLDDLRSCLEHGGTVLLTGAGDDDGRLPLTLVGVDDERGVLLLQPTEGPSSPVEVSVAAFQQAWDDTAAQMVVAGDDGRTLLLPVTVPAGAVP